MNTIIQTFWDFLLNVIQQFVKDICYPIDVLLQSSFNDINFSSYINMFYDVLEDYIIPAVSWFVDLVPPNAWNLIVLYYTFIVIFYGIVLVSHLIYFPLKFIKKYIPTA